MIYVLIVLSWYSGYVRGAQVVTQEFSSEAACVQAQMAVEREFKGWDISDRVRAFCVPK